MTQTFESYCVYMYVSSPVSCNTVACCCDGWLSNPWKNSAHGVTIWNTNSALHYKNIVSFKWYVRASRHDPLKKHLPTYPTQRLCPSDRYGRLRCKQLLNLAIFTTLSLFNLLAVPAPHFVTLSLPPTISLKITDRSFRYASPCL